MRFKLDTKNAASVVALFVYVSLPLRNRLQNYKIATIYANNSIRFINFAMFFLKIVNFYVEICIGMCTEQDKNLKERIKHVLGHEGIKLARIANTEGERTMMSRQINGAETTVPFMTIYKILNAVPHISADWLVMGEGSMYKADHVAPHIYTQHNEVKGNSAGGDINVGPDTIVTKKTVERLETRVAELEQDKKNMQTLIDALTVKPRK